MKSKKTKLKVDSVKAIELCNFIWDNHIFISRNIRMRFIFKAADVCGGIPFIKERVERFVKSEKSKCNSKFLKK